MAVPFYTLITAQINQINVAKSIGRKANVDAAERRRPTIFALDCGDPGAAEQLTPRSTAGHGEAGAVDVTLDRSHRNDDWCPLAERPACTIVASAASACPMALAFEL